MQVFDFAQIVAEFYR